MAGLSCLMNLPVAGGLVQKPHAWTNPSSMSSSVTYGEYQRLSRTRPAAQRAVALKDKHKFKTEMDEVAVAAMRAQSEIPTRPGT
jgi:hypothetical protein